MKIGSVSVEQAARRSVFVGQIEARQQRQHMAPAVGPLPFVTAGSATTKTGTLSSIIAPCLAFSSIGNWNGRSCPVRFPPCTGKVDLHGHQPCYASGKT